MSGLIKTGTQIHQLHMWSERFAIIDGKDGLIEKIKEKKLSIHAGGQLYDGALDWILHLLEG